MLFVTSCSNNDDPTPPAPTPGTTYLKILKEDVNTCLEKYPAYKKESQFDYPYGYFLEARYTLNGNVADLPANELVPVSVDYGFAYTTIVRLRRPTLPDSGFRTIYRFDVAKGEKTVVYVDAATGAVETGEVL